MNYFNYFQTNGIINALGWTILHSVWQIALVAALFGLNLVLMKKCSSASKYYISISAMFLILTISIVTFVNEYSDYKTETNATSINYTNSFTINGNSQVVEISKNIAPYSFNNQVKTCINNNMIIIVGVWNLCVMVLLIKLIGGLLYSHRLKNHGTQKIPGGWNKKLAQLSESIGIKKSVMLLESAIAKTPIVIGYLKPVILLPFGLITGLSTAQIEAILMHELAHIKRNDYLINIFLSIIEVLFFFHPAFWWISNIVKTERENACDDLTVSMNVNKLELAKALVYIEELNQKKLQLAIAFIGNKQSLIKRIKHMTIKHSTKFTLKEGLIGACLLLSCLIIMAFSSNALIKNEKVKNNHVKDPKFSLPVENNKSSKTINRLNINKSSPSEIVPNENKKKSVIDDTIITINQDKEIIYEVNRIHYKLNFNDKHEIDKFYVEETEIPKSDWNKYEKTINEAIKLRDFSNNRQSRENKKSKIIYELVEDMKNTGLIDKGQISYKVHFYDTYVVINDEKQPDEVFQKYKKMFDEKSQGKYELDTKLNVNPNYYKKSAEEIQKMQIELQKTTVERLKVEFEKLKVEFERLKVELQKKMKTLETLEDGYLKNDALEQLKKNELVLKKNEIILKNHEEELKKREEELQEMQKSN